jgi:hypothetical protein
MKILGVIQRMTFEGFIEGSWLSGKFVSLYLVKDEILGECSCDI